MTYPTIAISVRQPWAWLIVNGFKNIENRSWRMPEKYLGPVLIHVSKTPKFNLSEARDILEEMHSRHGLPGGISFPETGRETGGIVGMVRIVGDTKGHCSPWAEHSPDTWNWIMAGAKPLPFMPCVGRLGFFPVEYREPAQGVGQARLI